MKISKENPVIAWWSGGVTSAVTCRVCIDWFGVENVRIVFMDTKNEDESTYTFLIQCSAWYGREIETITNEKYNNIKEVWLKYLALNNATGAICSSELKRDIRRKFTTNNPFSYQAFGFDIDEFKRARGMKLNNPETRPIFPLIANLLSKKDCIRIIQGASNIFTPLELPKMYQLDYGNNNCWKTGCVKGGIGYWQKIQKEFPEKFDAMALLEHELTEKKGRPVTMLRDSSKERNPVFLKAHPSFPGLKNISMMKGRPPKPLIECNGFCGSNDLIKNETEDELNLQSY